MTSRQEEQSVALETINGDSRSSLENGSMPAWARLLEIALRHRKWILIGTASATAISTLVAFLLPLWYLSSSVIVVGMQSDVLNLSKLLGVSAGLASELLGKNKLADEVDRYEAIFRSERLRLAVIEKFDLVKVYEYDDPDVKEPILSTLKELDKNISFKDNKNGTITVSAYYEGSAEKSAEMTNFIVAMMDSINRQLSTESARNQRRFVEQKYFQAQEELTRAEENLKAFQKRHKVAEIKDQIRASLEASAQIEASAIASEVEYNVLRNALGDSHPQALQAKSRMQELRRQIKRLEQGGLESDIIVPLEQMPDLGMEYLRLYRNVLLQTKIVEFLAVQYEQAKIQEAKDTPMILVLDKARVPEWKSKPKRLWIILGGAALGLLLSLSVIWLYYEAQKPEFVRWKIYFRNALNENV
ncbi:MAG: Wzz/FepE/Etk N-terminal domain-containing protein [Chloroherpetonaceae bacterium]|nr:Wzz/FepE/Etk N-terminal domain-containing protein [Chloroherpetonaceae bacterium]MDW8438219.1 GNVR domain-containing protein [Chloroherpetonaceae bacterium]